MSLLKFGKGNAKLGKNVFTFSLPAGHTCPNANECLSKADKETGKISDGRHMQFRCFAASAEALYTNTRKARWHNFDLLRKLSKKGMTSLIQESLPKKADIIRIHVSGDFFNENYFLAWMEVAKNNPYKTFYFYTKMASYVVKNKESFPLNFVYTYSLGGKQDSIATENNLRFAKVVFSEDEAKMLGLEIDHDDSHAMRQGESFSLLLHSTQKANTAASAAISKMKKDGVKFAYSRRVPLTIVSSDDTIQKGE